MKRRLTDFLHIWSVNRLFVFNESKFQLQQPFCFCRLLLCGSCNTMWAEDRKIAKSTENIVWINGGGRYG